LVAGWGIVGGGILGSTLALRLARAGEHVTLFETAPHLGGLASAWSLGDVVWDRHYHVTLLSDRHTRGLLSELGLETELRWVETRTGSYFDGRLHPISNTVEYIRFPPLSMVDKARLAFTILYGARVRDWRRLEQTPVEAWLRRLSGDRVFERFWLPLLEAKLGDAYVDTSAAFIWATIQRLYAARNTGMKKEMFGYVPGGYARVLERLGEVLVESGVDVRLGARVTEVSSGPIVVTAEGDLGFDRVIVTTAPPITNRLMPGLSDEERSRLGAIRYQGIVCASALITKPLSDYYLTYLHDPAPFTAVVEMSAFVDPAEFGGRSLVYLPKYCDPADPFFEEPDNSIRDRFLEALERLHPQFSPSDVLAFRISRVRHVFAISTIGYSTTVPDFDTSMEGVHLVNSAQIVNGTLNVNETVELAGRGLRHLLGSHDEVLTP
jgi:protoporphyrinogen oxidase